MKSLGSRCVTAFLLLALFVFVVPTRVQAQAKANPTQVISINPLSLVFGGISAEYEHALGDSRSFGLAGTLYAPQGFTYSTLEAKGRFYPNAKALEGFSVGATAGVTHVSEDDFVCVYSCSSAKSTANALTAGIELDYQFLLGVNRNFSVALGIGAKRLIFLGDELAGASTGIPTARVSIGYGW